AMASIMDRFIGDSPLAFLPYNRPAIGGGSPRAAARGINSLTGSGVRSVQMPQTDGERVLADLKRLADFGRYKTGVHRPTYSAEDVASRQWLAEKFAEAGLDPVIDGIGNVIGHSRNAVR